MVSNKDKERLRTFLIARGLSETNVNNYLKDGGYADQLWNRYRNEIIESERNQQPTSQSPQESRVDSPRTSWNWNAIAFATVVLVGVVIFMTQPVGQYLSNTFPGLSPLLSQLGSQVSAAGSQLSVVKCVFGGNGGDINSCVNQPSSSQGPPAPPVDRPRDTASLQIVQVQLGSSSTGLQLPSLFARRNYALPVSINNLNKITTGIAAKNFKIYDIFLLNQSSNRAICGTVPGDTGDSGSKTIPNINPEQQQSTSINFNGKFTTPDGQTSGSLVNCQQIVTTSTNPMYPIRFKEYASNVNQCNLGFFPSDAARTACLNSQTVACTSQCQTDLGITNTKYGVSDTFLSASYISSTNECECKFNRVNNIMDDLCFMQNDAAKLEFKYDYDFSVSAKGELIVLQNDAAKSAAPQKPQITSGAGPLTITTFFLPDFYVEGSNSPSTMFLDVKNEGQGIATIKTLSSTDICNDNNKLDSSLIKIIPAGKDIEISCQVDPAKIKLSGPFATIPAIISMDYTYSQTFSQSLPVTVVHDTSGNSQLSSLPYFCPSSLVVYGNPSGVSGSPSGGTSPPPTIGPAATQSVVGSPSVTLAQINSYLNQNAAGSPLQSAGSLFYNLGRQYNIDPAFAIGVAQAETSLGKNGNTVACNNFFNIKSSTLQSGTCSSNTAFASFSTVSDGIEAFYKLINTEYIPNGQDTTAKIGCFPTSGFSTHCYCVDSSHSPPYCSSWASNVPSGISAVESTSATA